MTLKLVNDTPKISGNNVSINFTVTGPVAKVTCILDDKEVEEDCKRRVSNPVSWNVVFVGIPGCL